MMYYEGAEVYVAIIFLLKVCSSTNLFGHLHGENLHLAKDETNSCYTYTVGILYELDVQSLNTLESDLVLCWPWKRSYQ